MNEIDVVKQLLEGVDTELLVEAISDEFGQADKPPDFPAAARFLQRYLVNWNDLNGYDERDVASAIIRTARRSLDVKVIREAIRVELEKKWPTIRRELEREWVQPID